MNQFYKLYERVVKEQSSKILTEEYVGQEHLRFDEDDRKEKLYNFLISISKKSNGFLGDEISTLHKILNSEKIYSHSKEDEEFEKFGTITIDVDVTYYVPGLSGKPSQRSTIRTIKFYFNDEKTRLVKITKMTPKAKKEKVVFEADPNYKQKTKEDFNSQYELGDDLKLELGFVLFGKTRYDKDYFKFEDESGNEFISFGLPKLLPEDRVDIYENLKQGNKFFIDFQIQKKDIYRNKLNYVIKIKKIKPLQKKEEPINPSELSTRLNELYDLTHKYFNDSLDDEYVQYLMNRRIGYMKTLKPSKNLISSLDEVIKTVKIFIDVDSKAPMQLNTKIDVVESALNTIKFDE